MNTESFHIRLIRLVLLAGLVVGMTTSSASDLGRLFTTPEERQKIDAMRKGETATQGFQGDASTDETSDQLTLNGTLRGSNGRQRVWLNGEGVSPTGAKAPATLLYDGRVRLQWQGYRPGTTLKPGQTLDRVTGNVYEAYEVPVAETAQTTEE